MKKTIREWFNELPEPYRTQALENTEESILESYERDMSVALLSGFTWSESPQRRGYWKNLCDSYSLD